MWKPCNGVKVNQFRDNHNNNFVRGKNTKNSRKLFIDIQITTSVDVHITIRNSYGNVEIIIPTIMCRVSLALGEIILRNFIQFSIRLPVLGDNDTK